MLLALLSFRLPEQFAYNHNDRVGSCSMEIEVVVKFGWHGIPTAANNFVLTAYLVEKW